jgi:hypothetical protein
VTVVGFTLRVVVAMKSICQFRGVVLRSAMVRCAMRRSRDDVRPGQEQPEKGQGRGNRVEATHR